MTGLRFVFTLWLGSHAFSALGDDQSLEVGRAWAANYRDLPVNGLYHYRCEVDAEFPNREVVEEFGFISLAENYTIQISRLDGSVRRELRLGERWSTKVFHQGAAYRVSSDAKDHKVFPSTMDMEFLIKEGIPDADPLVDALGLSAMVKRPSRVAVPDRPYDIETVLATGDYTASERGSMVTLSTEGDEIVLDRDHGYALSRRTWHWTPSDSIRWTVENSEWEQFSDGTWYPGLSKVTYYGPPEHSSAGQVVAICQCRFSILSPVTEDDFELVADRPGWTIALVATPGKPVRRYLQEGEAIKLSDVATGKVEVRPSVRGRGGGTARLIIWLNVTIIALVAVYSLIRSRRETKTSQANV